eukprot:5297470-Pyramimonas_sp.AAC.1
MQFVVLGLGGEETLDAAEAYLSGAAFRPTGRRPGAPPERGTAGRTRVVQGAAFSSRQRTS